ncbi:UNVERIFIED_CONTAM: hypothetical protein HDU68_006960 [Siphonaria sp. JEL0065]|nr:hypothetical protein HDU68_006960 [Siphonaria sp. JEL0065]
MAKKDAAAKQEKEQKKLAKVAEKEQKEQEAKANKPIDPKLEQKLKQEEMHQLFLCMGVFAVFWLLLKFAGPYVSSRIVAALDCPLNI